MRLHAHEEEMLVVCLNHINISSPAKAAVASMAGTFDK
jgi:hypothetical protein